MRSKPSCEALAANLPDKYTADLYPVIFEVLSIFFRNLLEFFGKKLKREKMRRGIALLHICAKMKRE